jgi:hypothetical protein
MEDKPKRQAKTYTIAPDLLDRLDSVCKKLGTTRNRVIEIGLEKILPTLEETVIRLEKKE